ncbi:MAG: metallophosphoesterase [Syntrophorhabdaceae bacterium]|nr:metallophosphoesterase [Syntrophorhabdaceae bacterium]MDD5245370.1 metallophosphoesterase [Syntrophorhabdaceae bacterium]
MTLFLITFLFLYGTLHFYVFVKLQSAFHLRFVPNIFIIIFMAIMTLAPFAVRLAERAGHESFARFMAYAGYTWMGIIFLFFSLSVCIDILRMVIHFSGYILKRDLSYLTSAYRLFFIIPMIYALLASAYGYREAKNITVEKIVIKSPKISESVGKVTIAQISDIHLGLIVREERLRLITDAVKKANPDILVSTGDLVDGQIDRLNGLIGMLDEIKPRYGKFAITGNHEFYAGIKKSLDFTQKAGFRMLRGEGITIGGVINIVGVDDIAGLPFNYVEIPERILLSKFPQNLFKILLKHRPVVEGSAAGLFDLQLSGHTHKGQIFPFRFVTKLFFPLYTGYHSLPRGSKLYVNRGSGTWGPPIRFLASPEVTVIELLYSADKN